MDENHPYWKEPLSTRVKERAKKVIPLILGMGAGSTAAAVLGTQMKKLSPQAKATLAMGLPLAGGMIGMTLMPQLQKKVDKTMFGPINIEKKPTEKTAMYQIKRIGNGSFAKGASILLLND
jgi:hypothetical protein